MDPSLERNTDAVMCTVGHVTNPTLKLTSHLGLILGEITHVTNCG